MVAYHIVRNSEEALDVTQETFLRAWKGLARFDGTASFRSWLSRIATNAAIDLVRRRQAHPQTEFESAPMAIDAASRTTPAQPDRPGESLDQGEIRERFERALQTLSPEHRAVILLKEIENLSYQEIAAAVQDEMVTVDLDRTRMVRGMPVNQVDAGMIDQRVGELSVGWMPLPGHGREQVVMLASRFTSRKSGACAASSDRASPQT